MTICGNCGSTNGPFDRMQVGDRKTGVVIVTCRIPSGKAVTTDQQKRAALACISRRNKKESDGARAQRISSGGRGLPEPVGPINGVRDSEDRASDGQDQE